MIAYNKTFTWNIFGYAKRKNTEGGLTGSPSPMLERAFNYGQQFCRELHAHGGGGSGYLPKMMTSFMNSP